MKKRLLLAAILLGVVFCFVSGVGYGEILLRDGMVISPIEFFLLADKVDYIMFNPTIPLIVDFHYDPDGQWGIFFPEKVDTKGKIFIWIQDRKDIFVNKTGELLLDQLKRILKDTYIFISTEATNINTDVVALFLSKEEIPLGYFYQGEYHLWEE